MCNPNWGIHNIYLGPVAKFRWSSWLGVPRAGQRFETTRRRRINTIRQKGSVWRVLLTSEYWLFLFTPVDLAIG